MKLTDSLIGETTFPPLPLSLHSLVNVNPGRKAVSVVVFLSSQFSVTAKVVAGNCKQKMFISDT